VFLATTALEEFWDNKQEILFLGAWCLAADRQSTGVLEAHQTLPCPWNDRDRFYRAAEYVDSCSEALLVQLSRYLNGVHGTDHSERYWRIVLGPWLILYTHVIYDRLIHLQSAFELYSGLETIVMDPSSFRTPADFPEAVLFASSDAYNLQVFSQLLDLMGFRFPKKKYGSFGSAERGNPQPKAIMASALEKLIRLPVKARATTTVTRIRNLAWKQGWRLARATGFRVLPLHFNVERPFDRIPAVFNEDRLDLGKLAFDEPFQRILTALLPSHFPTLYLESYQAAHARIAKARQTPIIMSEYAWSGDEEFKFSAAQAAERRNCLVTVQHGGGYGAYRSAPYEEHERRIGDYFLAWGWADDQMRNCGNIVNPTFAQIEDQRRHAIPGNTILFVATNQPRFLHRFQSGPVGSQWEDYFDWQHRFITRMAGELRAFVCFRPYPFLYGHAGERRVPRSFPSLPLDNSPALDYEQLVTARIVVVDHFATVALEALAANVPAILFWDPDRWEMRSEVKASFDQLREAEILWDSPEGAAEKLANVYADPGDWWNSDHVQAIRKEFVSQQALTKQDWISSWIDNLQKIWSLCGGLG